MITSKKQISQALKTGIFFALVASVPGFGQNAEWTTTSDSDLNTDANWTPVGVPSGIATFDSTITDIILAPTATSDFTIGTFDFLNSASDFSFTFSNCSLSFNNGGVTGTETNTTITATNGSGNTLGNPQVLFETTPASIGSSIINLTNSGDSATTVVNGAQFYANQTLDMDDEG
jgi:hypothetical protein